MINKGSFVQYIGESTKQFWNGRYLMVHERNCDTLTVYASRTDKGRWKTAEIPLSKVKEVVA